MSSDSRAPFPSNAPGDRDLDRDLDRDAARRRRVSRLLRLAMSSHTRPSDELLERLARADGAEWFAAGLEPVIAPRSSSLEALLVEGRGSLAAMREIKSRSRHIFEDAIEGDDVRLFGIAGYFLAIAAARVHHETRICSRSDAEVDVVLRDLVARLPEPWTGLVARALGAG